MENDQETPRKISADQIEIVSEVKHPDVNAGHPPFGSGAFGGNIRVFKGGPLTLLFLPLLIPIFFIGLILFLVAALLMGKSAFKMIRMRR